MQAEPMRIPLSHILIAGVPGDTRLSPDADRARWLIRARAWARSFLPLQGRDVALACEDGFEFAAALFGAWQAGATPWMPADALPATLQRLRDRGLAFAGDLPGGLQAVAGSDDDSALHELDLDACTLVLFTSGSTGEPAAIRKSLRQLDAEVGALEAAFGGLVGDATVQGTVSHQHIYGLLFRILWPLSARRPFARTRLAYNEELTVLGPEPVALVASPAHLKRLPETQDWRQLSNALRVVFSSGGALPVDAARDVWRLWRQAPIEVFGSTETGGIAWRRADGSRSSWQPLPGVEWQLEDELLQVRSPHLPTPDWWSTSDRAFATGDGRFQLLGRADRIVKIEERRISLDAIEARLRESEWLDEVRLVALPGQRVLLAAVAVPTANGRELLDAEGRAAFAQRLRDWLSGHCDPIALPRRWRFPEAMPADARGKTSERALAALFRPLMPTPQWQARDTVSATATLLASPELAAFEGHFPQAPILPGVVLVDWAVRLSREAFGLSGGLLRMETLKFQQLVRPGIELTAELAWAPGRLDFKFTSSHGVHAGGRLRFDGETG
jgi:acyl-CoA synthetase (AMP-forming)/AMP-acid ligase II